MSPNNKNLSESDLTLIAQQKLLIEAAPKSLAVSAAAGIICYLLMHKQIPASELNTWMILFIVVALIRGGVTAWLRYRPNTHNDRVSTQALVLTASIFLGGLSWGSIFWLWSPSLELSTQFQILLFPTALAAGAISSYGMWLPAYLSFMVPCLMPPTAGFLLVDNGMHAGTAAPAILYMAALFALGKSNQKSAVDMISLGTTNNALIQNLTSRNNELLEAKEEAEAASKIKSEFMACMSHEIRTPIHGVLGVTEILNSTELTEQQKNFTGTIYQSANSLLKTINEILEFTKLEAGNITLESADFNLREAVCQLPKLLSENTAQNNNRFTIEYGDDVPESVCGDSSRIKLILMNVVGNAIKFTKDGDINLTVEQLPGTEDSNQRLIQFCVRDTGIGIPPDRLDNIFESFWQADSSMTRNYGGTGIGLTIVQQLLIAMGGTITVESTVGAGTCFTFSVPFSASDQQPASSAPAIEQAREKTPALENLYVLVAEDCPTNQLVIELILEDFGCNTTIVENGAMAIEAMRTNDFSVILMDCQMPVMDGYTATRCLRELEKGSNKHIPILAVTANSLPADRQRCIDAGMDDMLSKPFDQSELSDLLLRNLPDDSVQETLKVA